MKPRQAGLAERVRKVREDLYGEYGSQFLADALDLPLRTWANYEKGVSIPAEVILKLIDSTGVSPHWLLRGRGPMYPGRPSTGAMDSLSPSSGAKFLRPAYPEREAMDE